MQCPSCGARTSRRARFCDQCGAASGGSGRRRRRRPARRGPRRSPEAGDRRVVTALFADLVDYVRMIAEHDPEEVRARVGAALRRMADAIERLEGTREKFIGDAVFAVFGWPRRPRRRPGPGVAGRPRHPGDAARAGRRQRAAGGPDRDRHRRGRRRRRGTDRSGDLAVTGEAITTAARIQSLARPGEILLDEATVRGARDRLAGGRPRLGRAARPVLGGPAVRAHRRARPRDDAPARVCGRIGRSSVGRPRWRSSAGPCAGPGARGAARSCS